MLSKEKIILLILACINFTHIMDFMIMMPLGPQLMKLFQITPAQFGFAVSAYGFTAGASGFASAFFVDKFDRKKILFFAYCGFVIGTFACAFAPSYFWLVAARVLAGLFGGMIGAQVLSIVGDIVPYERRGAAMGTVMMAFSLASVVGVPAGLWLASKYSWHMPFLSIGFIGLFVIFLIAFFIPPITKHLQNVDNGQKQNPLHILTNILKNPNQVRAITLSGVLIMGHFVIIPFIAPSLVSNIGYSQDNIFLIYLVGGAFTIFTSPLVGKLADKRGKYPIFVIFALLSFVPIWLITNLWIVPLWFVLVISGLFFIAANGRMIPMQAMVSSVVSPQQRGGFMAINSSVQQLSTALAANIGGMMVYQVPNGRLENYSLVGYFSITLIGISIFLAKKLKPIDL